MVGTKSLAALLMGTALISLPAFSQESGPENRSEASAQFFGTFLKNTTKMVFGRAPRIVEAFWPAIDTSSPITMVRRSITATRAAP